MDIVFALVGLILLAPLLLVTAICIRLESPGPIIFRQTRLGRGGKPFKFFKFRTMRIASEQFELREAAFELRQDPRVTKMGRFLRRTSIDELPQLFNVLRGDISLVGPRPPLPWEVEHYERWHLERLTATPGITGLWQVYGRTRMSFDEMVKMDLEYIKHQSLLLDLKILAQSVRVAITADAPVER